MQLIVARPRTGIIMTKPSSTPILNTSLPSCFRKIRLELAREPGHPDGEWNVAYVLVAPLDVDCSYGISSPSSMVART